MYAREAGILLHPTSLPSPNGIGSLGQEAYDFVDFLAASHCSLWQVLPLGPTGYGNSPYTSFSSFAGNPLLISVELLTEAGWLHAEETKHHGFDPARVDFTNVIAWKTDVLEKAARRFLDEAPPEDQEHFAEFCRDNAEWLDDYALFRALQDHFSARAAETGTEGGMAETWDEDVRTREPKALARWREQCAETIRLQQVLQYFFFHQWDALHNYARERGIRIVGDVPIFVAPDSCDVWAAPQYFKLDAKGRQTHCAGVPPDYFSETGQRWGNPVYNWDALQADGFAWWVKRFRAILRLVDVVRVDHFRGFEAYWEIPQSEATAMHGEWIKAPGHALFRKLREELGELPFIAEDLGVITEEVRALRDDFGLPGMIVLQFAFDNNGPGDTNFLPHCHVPHAVIYSGTHDNDTTLGWFRSLEDSGRDYIRQYLGHEIVAIHEEFIRMAMASVARWAIVPMQDLLGLGSEARMNTPAIADGNWGWRCPADYRDLGLAERMAWQTRLYDRTSPHVIAREKEAAARAAAEAEAQAAASS